jgi:hypothetical protein
MSLRQRIKKLETPRDHSRNYLIRDFDVLCADRAMNVLTSADRKVLAEARSLQTRGEVLLIKFLRVVEVNAHHVGERFVPFRNGIEQIPHRHDVAQLERVLLFPPATEA